jgi:hypothetical protein
MLLLDIREKSTREEIQRTPPLALPLASGPPAVFQCRWWICAGVVPVVVMSDIQIHCATSELSAAAM